MQGFELTAGRRPVPLPLGAQRVLAFLALQNRPVLRAYAAGNLWLDKPEKVACASLRSALWQVRRFGLDVVTATPGSLHLSPALAIDVHETLAHAQTVVRDPGEMDLCPDHLLTGELLPDWCDDWVIIERERVRQLRLHALELLGYQLIDRGRTMEAIEVALAAVAADPLRESAHRLLISAHLAEGNRSEALRQFTAYARLLGDDLGLTPSDRMAALVAPIRRGAAGVSGRPPNAGPPGWPARPADRLAWPVGEPSPAVPGR
ncbi:BTAD domain-containing putative transcriptional regulator [Nonomuraea sp. NPDC050153]|uniref:AfsR/SARP family transcriptional regulator n=1 Tax=Nonomuraea sp. NPDC050153 TaxID=3364359 RepID=UPI0037898D6F